MCYLGLSTRRFCYIPSFLICIVNIWGKVSAQLRTIVKQICSPNGNVLFSLFKNWMHNVGWGWAEILPHLVTIACVISWRMLKWQDFRNSGHSKLVFNNYNSCLLLLFFNLIKNSWERVASWNHEPLVLILIESGKQERQRILMM